MPSSLVRAGLVLVLVLVLVPPAAWSFSQGANDASCQEMVPGHIRAQRQNLQHSHISLRASAASYLPGQLITVTVRSSRDFMGFLVQARSAHGAWDGSRAGAGVRSRAVGLRPTLAGGPGTRAGPALAGGPGTRAGPALAGGAWVLTPPGTHALRCLSDADTLTHSDKQLKRNLSFVWRAPDAPVGDIRFYITVVQSYFVYWAGVESAVVRDGSRRNTTGSMEAFRVHGPSAGSVTAQTSSATQNDANTSSAPAPLGTQTPTNTLPSNGSSPSVTRDNGAGGEAAEHTGSTVTQSQDPNNSVTPSNTAPSSSADAAQMEPMGLLLPNVSTQASTTPHSSGEKPNLHFKDQTAFAVVPSTIQHVPSTRPQRDTTPDAGDQTRSHSGSQSWRSGTRPQTSTTQQLLDPTPQLHPSLQPHTPSPRPVPTTSASDALPASQTPTLFSQPQTPSQRAEPRLTPHRLARKRLVNQPSSHFHLLSDSARPQPEARHFGLQSGPRETSAASLSSLPFSSAHEALPVTTDSPAQSEVPPEALSVFYQPRPRPNSQTESKPVDTSTWTPSLVSVKLRSGPVLFTPGHVNKGGQVNDFQHLEKIRGTNPMSATTNLPYPAESTQTPALRSSSSAPTFPGASLGHGSSNSPFLRSALGSIRPSLGNQPQTAAAILALPSPLPISIPPHFPSAKSSSSSPPSSVSVTVPFSNSSEHLLASSQTALFSVSSPSSFTSSQHVKGSTLSPSTVSAVVTSSSNASLNSPVSSSTFPPSPSSSMSFHSTTPHPGPSPAPRRSLYNPVSSVSQLPLQRVTVGQKLLIHNHMLSSKPGLNLNPPTQRNPRPHPNPLDLKPNTSGKPKNPSIPSKTPDKEGKYPDIVPRHSAWELGMLLGCSAGLGMVLVVGLRYMYRQACGKKTQMTLNDREREYGRGERGLVHVQECGDLVRVRRIRENSFVLLAEYDILTSPGD
ncbi:uncharacterized protein LOC114843610 [Betta splendens]|uniref:Uncharacterized protein LOC114843610 n=1 Tax=Betta splendens TaxID=158456 RepID=A0A8M1HLN3_BETSP|nr:uncharacterized protein LOC114843610 [Betta splendens]XP_040929087.1 uncharacterized protein LOC114843610 [Betta splendens]